MDYITKTTEYPPFTPCPNSLFEADLSATAKLTYLVLLNRALLSRSNDWIDEQGRVFIVYPIEQLAQRMKKSETCIFRALRELDNAHFIVRLNRGFNHPNHIYVLMEACKNDTPGYVKNDSPSLSKTTAPAYQKRHPNDNKHNYNKENYTTHTTPDLSDLLMKGDDR